MLPEDIPAGVSLVELSNWNQTEREWSLFLEKSPRGCVVAELDGQVIGTATTLDYGPFAWISMVLVHPGYRGKGIGNGLMLEALQVLENHPCMRLDATPLGEPVYRKLGFAPEYSVIRMERGDGPALNPPNAGVVAMRHPDSALDFRAFAADRRCVLSWLRDGAPDLALTIPGRGFLLGRRGSQFVHLGPISAVDEDSARMLLLAALPPAACIIDVPEAQHGFCEFLKDFGFREQRPLLRMSRGAPPPCSPLTFAIAGPELG